MSVSPSPASPSVPDAPPFPDVVARLRAAGCVFAEEEARMLVSTAGSDAELADMVGRRAAGLPLEHVLGWAEFHGLRVSVAAGVFVPRRRSEFLAERAVAAARALRLPAGTAPVLLDLCCGSGALGAAVASELERVELHASDIEPAAVRCARDNLAAFGGTVYEGDLFDALPPGLRGRVGILLANAPYVPTGEIGLLPPEARDHEPLVTLDGGADGLAVLRRVASAAGEWLLPGGHLLVETSEAQAPRAVEVFTRRGLTAEVAEDDDRGATVVIGTRPA